MKASCPVLLRLGVICTGGEETAAEEIKATASRRRDPSSGARYPRERRNVRHVLRLRQHECGRMSKSGTQDVLKTC